MLGFGKKKDKDTKQNKSNTEDTNDKKTDEPDKSPKEESKPKIKAKKKFPVKLILSVFFILCIGIGGYFVYSSYFSAANDLKPVYKPVQLEYIHLSEEILKFSFDYFPDLYLLMITANNEIDLMEKEISRIEMISKKYPDQIKISQKEKKIWEKTRDTLQKSFRKIEKPVKETYVLYQVNKPAGQAQIEAKASQLIEAANAALVPVQELTNRIKTTEVVPEGFVKGNIYKIKKKFL